MERETPPVASSSVRPPLVTSAVEARMMALARPEFSTDWLVGKISWRLMLMPMYREGEGNYTIDMHEYLDVSDVPFFVLYPFNSLSYGACLNVKY